MEIEMAFLAVGMACARARRSEWKESPQGATKPGAESRAAWAAVGSL